MALKIILLLMMASLGLSKEIFEPKLSKENENLIEALKVIRYNLIHSSSAIGFSLISIDDPSSKDIHEAVKQEIVKNAYKMESIRLNILRITMPTIVRYSVILIDNIKVFKSSEEQQIDFRKFHNAKLHIIVLLDGTLEDLHEIFTLFYSKSILNVLALMNLNGTLLLTFESFADPTKCDDTTPKVINSFKNGKFSKALKLTKRINNMNLCPITVTTFLDTVATMKKTFANGSSTLHGSDIHMIQTISKMLNFTLNLRFREGAQQNGVIYENGTLTRGFGDIKNGNTEILMGNLFLKESRAKHFGYSIPYMNYPVLVLLSPSPKLNMLEKLLSPFDTTVWILLLLTISFGIVVILIINVRFKCLKTIVYGSGINDPMTNLFQIFVGQPLVLLPKKNFARFILMMFLILTLVIRSVYQGSLYKFLQSDGTHKEPQTIMELLDQEYVFVVSVSNLDIMKKYQSKIKYITKPQDEMAYAYSDLDAFIGGTEKRAVFTLKLELIYYGLNHDKFPYKICKEQYFTINIALFFNQNFYLQKAIDDAILRISAYGFMKHWLKEYDRTDRWKYKDKNPAVMTFKHLSGAFCLLVIGIVVGICVIVVEIVGYKLHLKYMNT
ncbi:hypothetical protein ACKWTF_008991 [Chironomus riparius]